MMQSFDEIFEKVQNLKEKKTIVVAMADSENVLTALDEVEKRGLVNSILVGDKTKIMNLAMAVRYNVNEENIVDVKDEVGIAFRSVELIREHRADILMKGRISTPILMKAVLDSERGLRKGDILSHVAVLEVPNYTRLLFITDGGINIKLPVNTKRDIIKNAIDLVKKLGVDVPNIAILCPIEKVNPKIRETVDALELKQMAAKGEFGDVVLEGPIATDVALSSRAGARKEIQSQIAGQTDIILVPDLSAGNVIVKALKALAGANLGGLVVGAKVPIVLLSRSDDSIEKINSIALSILACD